MRIACNTLPNCITHSVHLDDSRNTLLSNYYTSCFIGVASLFISLVQLGARESNRMASGHERGKVWEGLGNGDFESFCSAERLRPHPEIFAEIFILKLCLFVH